MREMFAQFFGHIADDNGGCTRFIGMVTNISALTPQLLSRSAAELYPEGPVLFRKLQRYRPYICPFEELIPEVPMGASVLDIGCGGGLFLGLIDAAGLKPTGLGFDVSAPAIRLADSMAAARRNRGGHLHFRRLAPDEPWPTGKFDVVSMIDVIHHVPAAAQENVIRRACRRVKPGGAFVYKDMVKRPRWRAFANQMHDLVLARQWIHYAPVAEVERWAADEGLALERAELINRLWYGHELRVFRHPETRTSAGEGLGK
jgi:2-polyprenyl-3-methyl-5-hydroxy-6-metoxy-1,4-benzoquinol methylase